MDFEVARRAAFKQAARNCWPEITLRDEFLDWVDAHCSLIMVCGLGTETREESVEYIELLQQAFYRE